MSAHLIVMFIALLSAATGDTLCCFVLHNSYVHCTICWANEAKPMTNNENEKKTNSQPVTVLCVFTLNRHWYQEPLLGQLFTQLVDRRSIFFFIIFRSIYSFRFPLVLSTETTVTTKKNHWKTNQAETVYEIKSRLTCNRINFSPVGNRLRFSFRRCLSQTTR